MPPCEVSFTKVPQSVFARRLGDFFCLLHAFQESFVLRINLLHDDLALDLLDLRVAIVQGIRLLLRQLHFRGQHIIGCAEIFSLDIPIVHVDVGVDVKHDDLLIVRDLFFGPFLIVLLQGLGAEFIDLKLGTGGHNLGCELVSSEFFHNCYLHCVVSFTVFIIHALRVIVKTFRKFYTRCVQMFERSYDPVPCGRFSFLSFVAPSLYFTFCRCGTLGAIGGMYYELLSDTRSALRSAATC